MPIIAHRWALYAEVIIRTSAISRSDVPSGTVKCGLRGGAKVDFAVVDNRAASKPRKNCG
jgi:hypothetical protein